MPTFAAMRMEDFWAWHYEKSGQFSVRSAYRMLIKTKQRRVGYPWIHYAIEHSGSVVIGDTQSPHCQMGERQRPLDDVRNGGP